MYSLTFALLKSRLAVGKEKSSPARSASPFSFRLPGGYCQGGEPPCSRCPCSSPGATVAHTLSAHRASLTTPSPASYYVNIPSLPPSYPSHLPLIQQLPAGLFHIESPEYCGVIARRLCCKHLNFRIAFLPFVFLYRATWPYYRLHI